MPEGLTVSIVCAARHDLMALPPPPDDGTGELARGEETPPTRGG